MKIPVVVNGDVRGGADAKRALEETGCAGVMVGRRAIEHPWVLREIRSVLDHGIEHAPPTAAERVAMCRAHLEANVAARGEHFGVRVTRRHLSGYLKGLPGAGAVRRTLLFEDSLAGCLEILARAGDSWSTLPREPDLHPIENQPSYTSSCSIRESTQSNSPDVTLARQ